MEQCRVIVTWVQGRRHASVTDETYIDDVLTHRHVRAQVPLDDPTVARAVAEWQEGTLRLFDA